MTASQNWQTQCFKKDIKYLGESLGFCFVVWSDSQVIVVFPPHVIKIHTCKALYSRVTTCEMWKLCYQVVTQFCHFYKELSRLTLKKAKSALSFYEISLIHSLTFSCPWKICGYLYNVQHNMRFLGSLPQTRNPLPQRTHLNTSMSCRQSWPLLSEASLKVHNKQFFWLEQFM